MFKQTKLEPRPEAKSPDICHRSPCRQLPRLEFGGANTHIWSDDSIVDARSARSTFKEYNSRSQLEILDLTSARTQCAADCGVDSFGAGAREEDEDLGEARSHQRGLSPYVFVPWEQVSPAASSPSQCILLGAVMKRTEQHTAVSYGRVACGSYIRETGSPMVSKLYYVRLLATPVTHFKRKQGVAEQLQHTGDGGCS